jgi:hypothetical protein
MFHAVAQSSRRLALALAAVFVALGLHAGAASADVVASGYYTSPGYDGTGTCTVRAQLHLEGRTTFAKGNVDCTKRQGYTVLRVVLKRDGVPFEPGGTVVSPSWHNSFGQGNAWYSSVRATACVLPTYNPRWSAVVTAELYDYYGVLRRTTYTTTSNPRVLC